MILAAYNSGYNKYVSTTTQALGSSIMANLQELGIKSEGFWFRTLHDENYKNGAKADYYSIVREGVLNKIPSLIIEHGYVSNKSDCNNYFKTAEQRNEFTITADPALLRGADRVLLPGVGEASSAMAKLRERGLDLVIPTLTQPVLGICIGMQLLCLDSEEGDARCLGIFPAHVRRLKPAESGLKIPHVGWNTVGSLRGALFEGIGEETYVYYVHSYAAEVCEATIARTDYGGEFSAALGRGNFFGTQFHPEKSGSAGERILRNFLKP